MNELVKTEEIQKAKEKINGLLEELKKEITGQTLIIRNIMTCLVAQGHVLLEGMPGLAKTLLAKSIAQVLIYLSNGYSLLLICSLRI